MTDEELRAAYQALLATPRAAGRAGCVSPEALPALAERRGSEAERLATLDHAMACAECRRDLELLRAVAAAGVTEGVGARTGTFVPSLRMAAMFAALAASAAAITVTLRRSNEPTTRGGNELVMVAPVGPVRLREARLLVWHASAGASSYRVELLTASGDSVYAALTPDTTLALPPDLALGTAHDYLWTVRPSSSSGAQAASAPSRFRIIE